MSDIKIIKRSIFISFLYGAFNGANCFNEHQFMFINFHLFSVDQCVSLIFHESCSYLMVFCASITDIRIMRRSVFIQFWYGVFNGAICF